MLSENGNPPATFDVDTITAFRAVAVSTAEESPSQAPIQAPSQAPS
jgi:hypothetical protein